MSPKEIPTKFVSVRMMAKEVRYVDDIANGPLPQHYKPHLIALKATANKDVLPDKVAQIEVELGFTELGFAELGFAKEGFVSCVVSLMS
jgi:hypothetical protein